jgi:ATP-dependent DNA helicase RecG
MTVASLEALRIHNNSRVALSESEATTKPSLESAMTVETTVWILEALRRNPSSTLSDVAKEIGKSLRTVERVSGKLVDEGKLKHAGPKKGGHWEVLEK